MKKVLFVHQEDPGPHNGFAESINADFIFYKSFSILKKTVSFEAIKDIVSGLKLPKHGIYTFVTTIEDIINGLKLPKYEVYLCEGGAPTATVVIRKITNHGKPKVIALLADQTSVMLSLGIPKRDKLLELKWNFFSKHIDGAIAVSKFTKGKAATILKCPIRIAYPFMEDDKYHKLINIKPDFKSHNIASVGNGYSVNGTDVLVEAFKIVKQDFDDAELYIIGRGHPKEWEKNSGVHILGFMNDLTPYFEKSSLFVLVGKGHAFPVATIEALRAGIPTIVSEYTGTKEVIQKLGDNFVGRVDAKDIANRIIRYFNMTYEEKEELSEQARVLSEEFNRKDKCKEFKKQFALLLKEI